MVLKNMKRNLNKKLTTGLCHYCDWSYLCRKGHGCGYYKATVKSKSFKNRNKIKRLYQIDQDPGE